MKSGSGHGRPDACDVPSRGGRSLSVRLPELLHLRCVLPSTPFMTLMPLKYLGVSLCQFLGYAAMYFVCMAFFPLLSLIFFFVIHCFLFHFSLASFVRLRIHSACWLVDW